MVEARSREEYEDKAIVLRKMLYEAIEHYLLRCCEKGRISIGKVAEILKKSIYDVMEDAKERGIKLGATEKQEQVVMLTAKNIKISQEELSAKGTLEVKTNQKPTWVIAGVEYKFKL